MCIWRSFLCPYRYRSWTLVGGRNWSCVLERTIFPWAQRRPKAKSYHTHAMILQFSTESISLFTQDGHRGSQNSQGLPPERGTLNHGPDTHCFPIWMLISCPLLTSPPVHILSPNLHLELLWPWLIELKSRLSFSFGMIILSRHCFAQLWTYRPLYNVIF